MCSPLLPPSSLYISLLKSPTVGRHCFMLASNINTIRKHALKCKHYKLSSLNTEEGDFYQLHLVTHVPAHSMLTVSPSCHKLHRSYDFRLACFIFILFIRYLLACCVKAVKASYFLKKAEVCITLKYKIKLTLASFIYLPIF